MEDLEKKAKGLTYVDRALQIKEEKAEKRALAAAQSLLPTEQRYGFTHITTSRYTQALAAYPFYTELKACKKQLKEGQSLNKQIAITKTNSKGDKYTLTLGEGWGGLARSSCNRLFDYVLQFYNNLDDPLTIYSFSFNAFCKQRPDQEKWYIRDNLVKDFLTLQGLAFSIEDEYGPTLNGNFLSFAAVPKAKNSKNRNDTEDSDKVTFCFHPAFAAAFLRPQLSGYTPMPLSLFSLPQTPKDIPYNIGKYICTHANIRRGKKDSNLISIAELLKAVDLPSKEEVKGRHYKRDIIDPIDGSFKDLIKLGSFKIFYADKDGRLLTSEEVEKALADIDVFLGLSIVFEIVDYDKVERVPATSVPSIVKKQNKQLAELAAFNEEKNSK